MAQHNNVYQRSVYYDIIFNRDVTQEINFITDLYRKVVGNQLQSIVDIACGPGYHARALAKGGVRAVGLDLRPEMLDFARDQAEAEGNTVDWLVADMRYFKLDQPVDMAIIMFDGIDALLTNEDIADHFRAVAANLTPNGLYLIESTHPRNCSLQDYGTFRYSGSRDGIEVEIDWAVNDPIFDLASGVIQTEVEMRVNDHGQEQIIRDFAQERVLCPQEFQLLAQLSGALRVVDWYGEFDLNQPLDHTPASRQMITIMQKIN